MQCNCTQKKGTSHKNNTFKKREEISSRKTVHTDFYLLGSLWFYYRNLRHILLINAISMAVFVFVCCSCCFHCIRCLFATISHSIIHTYLATGKKKVFILSALKETSHYNEWEKKPITIVLLFYFNECNIVESARAFDF